jgi:ribosomal protein S18 acetylase RimI-like enzyme
MSVWTVQAPFPDELRSRLCEILVDSVEHGASVGFLSPLDAAAADDYWRRVERAVADERSILLAAGSDGAVLGTVQVDVDTPPNQPHRATVCKLLVHTDARRRGLGEALMVAAEEAAAAAGRWLLVLDTATPAAERLYRRLGWTVAGVVPDYAMNPDCSLTQTVFYWKALAGRAPAASPRSAPRR